MFILLCGEAEEKGAEEKEAVAAVTAVTAVTSDAALLILCRCAGVFFRAVGDVVGEQMGEEMVVVVNMVDFCCVFFMFFRVLMLD